MPAAKAGTKKVPMFYFTGRFEKVDEHIFAVCEHAPLVTQGKDPQDALEHMGDAIRIFLETLIAEEKFEAALRDGVVRFGYVDIKRRQPRQRTPRLKLVEQDGFEASIPLELAA